MAASREDAARERLLEDLFRLFSFTVADSRRLADYILARQREREGPLVEAAERLAPQGENFYGRTCVIVGHDEHRALRSALARYRALDAPPPRTLAEVAADIDAQRERIPDGVVYQRVPKALLDELREVRREKEGR